MTKDSNSKKELLVDEISFERARFKHWFRLLGFGLIVLLNISMFASTISLRRTIAFDPAHELPSLFLVLFFDVVILLPMTLEVDKIIIAADFLILKNLLWTSRIAWTEVVSFAAPVFLTYSILRTKRMAYLLNKRDIHNYPQMLELVQKKLEHPN